VTWLTRASVGRSPKARASRAMGLAYGCANTKAGTKRDAAGPEWRDGSGPDKGLEE